MKLKPIIDVCEKYVIEKQRIVDWSDLRDMIDVETGSELPPSKLDATTQQLVNRLHKKAPNLLRR